MEHRAFTCALMERRGGGQRCDPRILLATLPLTRETPSGVPFLPHRTHLRQKIPFYLISNPADNQLLPANPMNQITISIQGIWKLIVKIVRGSGLTFDRKLWMAGALRMKKREKEEKKEGNDTRERNGVQRLEIEVVRAKISLIGGKRGKTKD